MSTLLELGRQLQLALERSQPNALRRWFAWLDLREIRWVQSQNTLTRHPFLRGLAVQINRLGNGWMYIPLSIGLILAEGRRGLSVFELGGISLLLAHIIYPFAKAFTARPRPFETGSVRALCTPLDHYSFPSGHCMTACAVFVPIGVYYPYTIPAMLGFLLLLAWAQIACAHHYPSDLISGAALGSVIALLVCGLHS